jgi:hypothetical protein
LFESIAPNCPFIMQVAPFLQVGIVRQSHIHQQRTARNYVTIASQQIWPSQFCRLINSCELTSLPADIFLKNARINTLYESYSRSNRIYFMKIAER